MQLLLPVRYVIVRPSERTEFNQNDDLRFDVKAKNSECRYRKEVLSRGNGWFVLRLRILHVCLDLNASINVIQNSTSYPVCSFKIMLAEPEECSKAENSLSEWLDIAKCPSTLNDYSQMNSDFHRWPTINMTDAALEAEKQFGSSDKKYSVAYCHYRILDNEVYRKCYGQHTGFRMFSDEILTSMTRKMKLPNFDFLMNLGDWPLSKKNTQSIPFVSWCGSNSTYDLVLPTYEFTNSVLHSMQRVSLDVHTAIGTRIIEWNDKNSTAVFYGRDSNEIRLKYAEAANLHPNVLSGGITRYFFHDQNANINVLNRTAFHNFFKARKDHQSLLIHKFVVNLDGTVAAYRLPFLLSGDSLVFKQQSSFYEHFYADLIPDLHFIEFTTIDDLVQMISEWPNRTRPDHILTAMRQFWLDKLQPLDLFCYYAKFFEEYSKRLVDTTNDVDGFELVNQLPKDSQSCIPAVSDRTNEL
ncbi:KDEL domain-containing protein-containing protein 2 [Aphelenchoides besseyi]|nr:KDEL domain-containing protein-containing protein 2 [Aphelenchoides besseyi]